jgi:hypothetical protein
MALMCLLSRASFFAVKFLYFNSYWNLLLIVIPGIFSLSVVISQTLVYAVLTIELSFFVKKRAKDAATITAADVHSFDLKILSVQTLYSIAIGAAFVAFGVQFVRNEPNFMHNTIEWWKIYGDQLDFWYGFALVLLIISTIQCLR